MIEMKIEKNKELKEYTTLYIGGPAKKIVHPESLQEIKEVYEEAKKNGEKLFVLGNGSNVLFEDKGFNGTVLRLVENWNDMKLLDHDQVEVQSGATNEELAAFAQKNGLSGYEFACGVPGTIGGAVVMNAGCYNSETKNVLKSVTYLDEEGNIQTKDMEDLDLSYRHSYFSDHFGIVLSAVYQFEKDDPEKIQERMDELQEKRYAKQPMDKHSCGSTFKRPEGYFAAALIDQAGLRGFKVGDAMVSEKHTGFLINNGNCTEKEFKELISEVQKRVKEHSGVDLECEVREIKY